jgi:hypothetical protein
VSAGRLTWGQTGVRTGSERGQNGVRPHKRRISRLAVFATARRSSTAPNRVGMVIARLDPWHFSTRLLEDLMPDRPPHSDNDPYESDRRGEHQYPDQADRDETERPSQRDRDELKERLEKRDDRNRPPRARPDASS